MEYRYGMRLRGFSPGCQPKTGLIGCEDGGKRYHDILVYKRPLTAQELADYELDDFNGNTRRELNMIVRPAGGTAGGDKPPGIKKGADNEDSKQEDSRRTETLQTGKFSEESA